jgi:hypothetical protein
MKPTPKPTFRQQLWSSVEPFLIILLRDIILFLIVLAALLIVYAGVGALKALGMSPNRLEILEAIHYYVYLAVTIIFLIDMLIKTILTATKGKT